MYKWKEIYGNLCSWIGKCNIIMKTTLTNLIYKVNTIHIKIPAGFFLNGKWILNAKDAE